MEKERIGVCFLDRNTLGVKRVCSSFGMKTRTNNKLVNQSHELAQTKQEVGKCRVGALLVHKRITCIHGLTKLTIARTWGSHHLPPYNILCDQPLGLHPNVILSRDSQVGNLEIPQIGIHGFLCKPPIEVKYEETLQPSLRAFQGYVACHLQACKLV